MTNESSAAICIRGGSAHVPAPIPERVSLGGGYFATSGGLILSERKGSARPLAACFQKGYPFVTLYRGAGKEKVAVHRLILEAYWGPAPSPLHCCRHLDGNRANSRPDNLAWGTPLQNAQDTVAHGRSGRGEENTQARLTQAQVYEIRARYDAGEHPSAIALRFPVTSDNAGHIGRRTSWKWLPEREAPVPRQTISLADLGAKLLAARKACK